MKFKAKDSETKAISLCLENIWKYFSVDNMKKTGFYGYIYDFGVYYDAIVVGDILQIYKHLIKKHGILLIKCLDLLEKFFL